MGQVVVVGLDIAKSVFQVHSRIATVRWWCGAFHGNSPSGCGRLGPILCKDGYPAP